MKKIIIALVTFAIVMALALPVQAMQIAGAGLFVSNDEHWNIPPTPTPEPFPDRTPPTPTPEPPSGGNTDPIPSPITVVTPPKDPQLSVYWQDDSRIFIGTDSTNEILPVMDALEKYLHNPKILKKIVNLLITRHAKYADQYDDLVKSIEPPSTDPSPSLPPRISRPTPVFDISGGGGSGNKDGGTVPITDWHWSWEKDPDPWQLFPQPRTPGTDGAVPNAIFNSNKLS